MRIKKTYFIVIVLLFLTTGFIIYWQFFRILPDEPKTYYKIFNYQEILKGSEDKAVTVDAALDKRLAKYEKTFSKIAGTEDEETLKALFYMNFVHFYGFYGKRVLNELSIKEILWADTNRLFHCGTNTTLLEMLLEKGNFESRTLSINSGGHGLVEVKLNNKWNLLDPTTNIWYDAGMESIIAGEPYKMKIFFNQAEDEKNAPAREHMQDKDIKCNAFCLKSQMTAIGTKLKVRIDKYNYIDLSQYQY